MKILFILKESTMHERMGLMYLGSRLKSNGHEVKLALADRLGLEGLEDIFRSYRPSVVGYSAMTGEHTRLTEINGYLKKSFSFTAVFGGPHATFFPDLINEESVDAVCIGEGDAAFPEFCRRLEQGENYWETQNFIVKVNGNIFRNPLSPLIENLDDLPFPDRELMYEADPDLLSEGKKVFFSARGCPYECAYCFNKKYNELYSNKGRVVRFRSPESLISEICAVKSAYPLDIVLIDDDTFLLKPKDWFVRFGELYRNKVGLPLSCNIRADLVTEENIGLLKDAGLDSVWMGVECGDETVANDILSRRLKNTQLLRASEIIKRQKVKIATQNLIGLPVRNSFEVDLKTLDLNIKIKPTFAWASILYPYPGTPIESYAHSNNLIEERSYFLETNKRSTILSFSKKEKRDLENLHKLFGLIVRFPALRKIIKYIVRIPAGSFYNGIFYLWYGYNYKIKLYPFRSVRKEIFKYARLWWRVVKKK